MVKFVDQLIAGQMNDAPLISGRVSQYPLSLMITIIIIPIKCIDQHNNIQCSVVTEDSVRAMQQPSDPSTMEGRGRRVRFTIIMYRAEDKETSRQTYRDHRTASFYSALTFAPCISSLEYHCRVITEN